jgi:hypothetical protein
MMRYIDRSSSPAPAEGFWGEAGLLDGEDTALIGISIYHELVPQLADLVPSAPTSLRCATQPMTFCMTLADRARSSGWHRKRGGVFTVLSVSNPHSPDEAAILSVVMTIEARIQHLVGT